MITAKSYCFPEISYHLRRFMVHLSQAAAPDHIHLKLESSIEKSCLLGRALSTLAGSKLYERKRYGLANAVALIHQAGQGDQIQNGTIVEWDQ